MIRIAAQVRRAAVVAGAYSILLLPSGFIPVIAAEVTLAWDPSPDPSISSYYVYYGLNSGDYLFQIPVGGNVSVTIPDLLEGVTYYFAATAVDSAGLESPFSNEASVTTPSVTSNVVLEATSIPNPFAPTAGIYSGLFSDPNGVQPTSAGGFKVSATSRGTYSGQITMGGKHFGFSGRLSPNGLATQTLRRGAAPNLTLQFGVGMGDQIGKVYGQVTDGTWVANLSANRSGFRSKSRPAPWAGNYTLALSGQASDPALPAGASYAVVRVGRNGMAMVSGTLADGTRFVESSLVSDDGTWPVFSPMRAGTGMLWSWLTFGNPTNDIDGSVFWSAPSNPRAKFYRDGFAGYWQVLGSTYPLGGGSGPLSGGFNLAFSGGDLGTGFTNRVTLTPSGRPMNSDSAGVRLSVAPSGVFHGSAPDPGSGAPIRFNGVMLPKTGGGYGFLLDGSMSSLVRISL